MSQVLQNSQVNHLQMFMQGQKNLHRQQGIDHCPVAARRDGQSQALRHMPQVITGKRRKQHGREFKGINQGILLSDAAAAQEADVERNTMANDRVVADETLKLPGDGLKTRRTAYFLRSNAGQTLHAIGDRTPGGNKRLHPVKDGRTLKLNGGHLQDCILFNMQTCRLKVEGDADRWLFTHKYSLRFSVT